jgi:hypothetical protein
MAGVLACFCAVVDLRAGARDRPEPSRPRPLRSVAWKIREAISAESQRRDWPSWGANQARLARRHVQICAVRAGRSTRRPKYCSRQLCALRGERIPLVPPAMRAGNARTLVLSLALICRHGGRSDRRLDDGSCPPLDHYDFGLFSRRRRVVEAGPLGVVLEQQRAVPRAVRVVTRGAERQLRRMPLRRRAEELAMTGQAVIVDRAEGVAGERRLLRGFTRNWLARSVASRAIPDQVGRVHRALAGLRHRRALEPRRAKWIAGTGEQIGVARAYGNRQ